MGRGLQELLARAAADETFREELLGDPAVAPGLTSQERMILRSITRHQLEVMIDRCKDLHVQRRQFLGTATASAITLLGGASLSAWGTACDRGPRSNPAYDHREGPSGGIRPDMPGGAKASCSREVVVGEFRTLSGPGRSPGPVDIERLQDQVERICAANRVEQPGTLSFEFTVSADGAVQDLKMIESSLSKDFETLVGRQLERVVYFAAGEPSRMTVTIDLR
jgi:hypothetical protein